MPNACEISTDPSRFDIDLIHNFLGSSYWARNIPRAVVREVPPQFTMLRRIRRRKTGGFRSRNHGPRYLCLFGGRFCRVPECRGRSISRLLMRAILDHPDLQGLRRILLATRDAHGLYAKFGFQPVTPNIL